MGGLVSIDAEVEFLNAFFSTTKIYQVFVPTKTIQGGEDQPIVDWYSVGTGWLIAALYGSC